MRSKIKEPPPPFRGNQGAGIMPEAGSMKMVIWEQRAQKIAEQSRGHQRIVKWSKGQDKSSGRREEKFKWNREQSEMEKGQCKLPQRSKR